MKAFREALLYLTLLCIVVFPFTPFGCYTLWNAKDGIGDSKAVLQYLHDRGIPVVDNAVSRRNLGVTSNCEATFQTDTAAFQKIVATAGSKIAVEDPNPRAVKALAKLDPAKRLIGLQNILPLPPGLSDSDKSDYVRSYDVDNLLIFYEPKGSLPTGWTEARFFVIKITAKQPSTTPARPRCSHPGIPAEL